MSAVNGGAMPSDSRPDTSDSCSPVGKSDAINDAAVAVTVNGSAFNGESNSLSNSLDRSLCSSLGADDVASCSANDDFSSCVADPDEQALLEKLQHANRVLEADSRSLHSLSSQHRRLSPGSSDLAVVGGGGLSRGDSMSSLVSGASLGSLTGGTSQGDDYSQENLWNLWGGIVGDWETVSKKKSSQVKELVRRGIPQPFRGIAWQLLCGVDLHCVEKRTYATYLKKTSAFEKTISRDITRTFPGHDLFKDKNGIGQESLFNVMKAYSLRDKDVGYCQGSGFIVGLLLMHMPEEEAFAVLVKIMYAYNLRELFKPSMAELGLRMFQLESMIQEQLPELYSHFQALGIATSMFASSWFLALYTTIFPLPLACRVFDAFLLEGMEVIFRVGIAILLLNLDDLRCLDMEETIKYLQKDLACKVESDADLLMSTAFQVKYNARKMKKLEKEYSTIRTKELEEQVELRRLRADNKLLQQRINNLEKETEMLADRLIQDQVKCAQQQEEICVLRQKVATSSRQNSADSSLQHSPDVMCTSTPSPDGVNSSLVAKMSRPLSLLPSPWFSSKDKTRHTEQLQKELDDAAEALLRTRRRLSQLESENDTLRREQERATSPEDVQVLHEEMIVCKLREAESSMMVKQLQNELCEIQRLWQKCREPSTNTDCASQQTLNNVVMAAKLKEVDLTCQLDECKDKLLITEQQNSVAERRNERLKLENDSLRQQVTSLESRLLETQHHLEATVLDLQTKMKEEALLTKLRDTEHAQLVTEMRRHIAELELQNEELTQICRQHECRNEPSAGCLDNEHPDTTSAEMSL